MHTNYLAFVSMYELQRIYQVEIVIVVENILHF